MEIHKKLDELIELVESARTMPMSSSAILNKTEVLSLVKQVRDMLPNSLSAADTVIEQREELLEEARNNASRMITDARAEQARLVGDHTVLVEARRERGRTLEQTRQEIEAMRVALDDHVDAKLAHVELVAERIVATVRDGRDQLRRSGPFDELATEDGSPLGASVGASELLRDAVDPLPDAPSGTPGGRPVEAGAQADGGATDALGEARAGYGSGAPAGAGDPTAADTWAASGAEANPWAASAAEAETGIWSDDDSVAGAGAGAADSTWIEDGAGPDGGSADDAHSAPGDTAPPEGTSDEDEIERGRSDP
ncbi:hypothetical protein [Phytoactinopolyspora mesophila]|uniref:ATP synthase F0 subunit B n=1 Tax=Phytoactinopolyspora mesophila TaxID=2650750 RepID=A0A7K3M8U9_9ACTN|nr:hypothetical protein [Phytoactinopolyspora mesophila]NDL59397.1 hypothetical protein [Phytoactinopolyspora mesophila]